VAHRRAAVGQDLDLRRAQPDAVGDGKARGQDAEGSQVGEGRPAVLAGPMQALVIGFLQMGLDAGIERLGPLGDGGEKAVGDPGWSCSSSRMAR
jgi:hypothetical protein